MFLGHGAYLRVGAVERFVVFIWYIFQVWGEGGSFNMLAVGQVMRELLWDYVKYVRLAFFSTLRVFVVLSCLFDLFVMSFVNH